MDWLTPTGRLVPWSPMLVTCALALATLVLLDLADRPLTELELTVSLVTVVIGALAGLDDPARDFVHAMPVSAARRLAHRLLVIVPGLALAVVLVRVTAEQLFARLPPAPGSAALVAFGSVGVALCAVLTRRLGARAVETAVSVMLVWLVIAVCSEQLHAPSALAIPWWRWPVAVTSVGAVVTTLATRRGVEA
jgi:hypothetical protein